MPLRRQMVLFKIGREDFALDILRAKEVVMRGEITPIPEAAESVEGILNLRGNLVPVLDLRKRLRAARADYETEERIIVVDFDGMAAGFIVDGASELLRVSDNEIESVPDILKEMGANYLKGIINQGGRHIAVVDIDAILDGEILCDVNRVKELLSSHGAANGREAL
ncbi:MAG TPA: chemotaxis protein CheW [Blastocatellia bacterium]|nr:chemotaxis protein CheW [Blastocatellia bacterium]